MGAERTGKGHVASAASVRPCAARGVHNDMSRANNAKRALGTV